MSRRDSKALGAVEVNTSQRLELCSGTTALLERLDIEGESVDSERVQELEQKSEMADEAVNAKDEEIQAKCAELEQCRQQAALELLVSSEVFREARGDAQVRIQGSRAAMARGCQAVESSCTED